MVFAPKLVLVALVYFWIIAASVRAADLNTLRDMLAARGALASSFKWKFKTEFFTGKRGFEVAKEKGIDLNRNWGSYITLLEELNGSLPASTNVVSSFEGVVFYDVPSGKCRAEIASVTPWVDGAAENVASRVAMAYDGVYWKVFQYSSYGEILPPSDYSKHDIAEIGSVPGVVEYSDVSPESKLRSTLGVSGLADFPLFFHSFGLSQELLVDSKFFVEKVLKASPDLSVQRKGEGLVAGFSVKEYDRWVPFTCFFSLSQGGALTEIRSANPEFKFIRYKQESLENGVWWPKEVLEYDWLNGGGRRVLISDVELDPIHAHDPFSIVVPDGVRVIDHVAGLAYTSGENAEAQAKAMQEYVRRAGALNSDSWLPMWAKLLTLGSILAVVFLLVLNKAGKRFFWMGCLFASLQSGGQAFCQPSSKFEWQADGWVLHSGQHSTRVTQCGFDVTLVMLHLMSLNFDAIAVNRELVPSLEGIRLSDIKRLLEHHGLKVEARQSLLLKDVVRNVSGSCAAIVKVPGPISEVSHYVVIYENESGQKLLLDPPKSPILLGPGAGENLQDVVALFCRKVNSKHYPALAVAPEEIVFGVGDKRDSDGFVVKSFEIFNPGPATVVSEIITPCGCIEIMTSASNLLQSEGKIRFDLKLDVAAWGDHRQVKEVLVETPQGIKAKVGIRSSIPEEGSGSVLPRACIFRQTIELPLSEISVPYSGQIEIPVRDQLGCLIAGSSLKSNVTWCEGIQAPDCVQINYHLSREQLTNVSSLPLKCELVADPLDVSGNPTRILLSFIRKPKIECIPRLPVVKSFQSQFSLIIANDELDDWSLTIDRQRDCVVDKRGAGEWFIAIDNEKRDSGVWELRLKKEGQVSLLLHVPFVSSELSGSGVND